MVGTGLIGTPGTRRSSLISFDVEGWKTEGEGDHPRGGEGGKPKRSHEIDR